MTPEDYEDDDIEVWPDNWDSVVFLSRLPHGAWEYGMNGRCRLDYQTIDRVLFKRFGVKKKDRSRIFADLLIMEVPALNAMCAD